MSRPPQDPAVGLCADCRHASPQRSARGSVFWRCRRADTDPDFLRYPPLPVTRCRGHEAVTPAGPKAAQAGGESNS